MSSSKQCFKDPCIYRQGDRQKITQRQKISEKQNHVLGGQWTAWLICLLGSALPDLHVQLQVPRDQPSQWEMKVEAQGSTTGSSQQRGRSWAFTAIGLRRVFSVLT